MLTHYLTRIASLPRAGGARSHPRLVPPLPPEASQQSTVQALPATPQTEREKAVQRALDKMENSLLTK